MPKSTRPLFAPATIFLPALKRGGRPPLLRQYPSARRSRRDSIGLKALHGLPLLLLILSLATRASAEVLYVGAGGAGEGCDFSILANALLVAATTAEDTTIHLATDRTHNLNYELNLDFDSGNIEIAGEHERCNQLGPPGTRAVVVSSSAGTPALTINGPASSSERIRIELRSLNLNANGGIGITLNGQVNTVLSEVDVFGGTTGVQVASGGLLTGLDLNVYDHNSLFHGAPIHCTGATSEVSFRGEVYDNVSAGFGGGLRIEDSCLLSLRPGTQIYDNLADVDGGGIYLASGATLVGGGDPTGDVVIAGNGAEVTGGGLYLTDLGTSATLVNARIHNNFSEQGAAVLVVDEAQFFMQTNEAQPCATPPRCAVVSNNVDTNGFRAIVGVFVGGTARFERTFFEGNQAGSLLTSSGTGSLIQGESLQLWNNRVRSVLSATIDGAIGLDFTTAARNSYDDGARGLVPARMATVNGEGSIDVDASVLVDSVGAVGLPGQVTGDCLLLDTDTGWTLTNSLVGADPRFAVPASGDLHLRSDSPAIDYCSEPSGTIPVLDLDGQARGFDNPWVVNLSGTYDLGADESYAEFLFRDGFESGDTGAWTGQ